MVRKLSKSIREYKKPSILSGIMMAGEVLMEVLIPYIMSLIIDVGMANQDITYVVLVGLAMLLMSTAGMGFGVLSGRYCAVAGAGFAKNLRKDMYYNIQNFSFSNIDKFSTSSLITRLTTDVTNVQNAYQMIIRTLIRAPIMLVCACVMAFSLNWKLALIFVAVAPLLAIFLAFIMIKAHPLFRQMYKKYDKVNSVVQENLTGIRVVKAFVREDHENEKFDKASGELMRVSKAAEKLLILTNPVMQAAMYICMLLVAWFGGNFIIQGSMKTGQLMSFLSYITQILMSLMMVSMVFVMIVMAKAAAQRITEVLDEKSDIIAPDDAVEDIADGSISFENVSFSYNGEGKEVLRNINLDIKSGQTIGIIGGTGSSKSTLVQLIPRLYDVESGKIKVGGRDVREYDLNALRNNVAMVLQKNTLFSGTIKDNLKWGDENATDEQIRAAAELAQADSFVSSFSDGYDTDLGQGGVNVSGGQKQRLCIARAALKNPKILILDDSTSAVDTKTDSMIRKGLRENLTDATKIIIAQRVSSIQDADKIIVLNNGEIVDSGTHEELLVSSEVYNDLYTSQVKGGGDES